MEAMEAMEAMEMDYSIGEASISQPDLFIRSLNYLQRRTMTPAMFGPLAQPLIHCCLNIIGRVL
jgi:hypothetical protein